MNLMFLIGKAVLHVVDTATIFSNATFQHARRSTYGQSTEGVWIALMERLCTMYTGYPNIIRLDQGSVFFSEKWKRFSNSKGIKIRLSKVLAHSSLGIEERLHQPLRTICNRVRLDFLTVNDNTFLHVAVKAINDTIRENGLVSSLLVLEIIPRLPIISTNVPTQKDNMEAIAKAQIEMNAILAERRASIALNKNVSQLIIYSEIEDRTLIYSETKNMWTGPFVVIYVDERTVTVETIDGSHNFLCNTSQLKPFYDWSTNQNRFVNCLTEAIP